MLERWREEFLAFYATVFFQGSVRYGLRVQRGGAYVKFTTLTLGQGLAI